MADEPVRGADEASAGAQAGADLSNGALLAELEAETGGKATPTAPQAKAAVAKKPAAKAEPVDDDEDDEPADDVDDDLEDEDEGEREELDDEDDDDPEDDEDEPTEADPALAKRIAAVRKMEQRTRAKLTAERAEFERERNGWQSQKQQVTEAQQRFDRLASRVRFDSYSVLKELGVPDEDMELHSQHLFARSKNAAATPAHRAAADRALREREIGEKASTAEQRVAELEKKLEAKEQQAAVQLELDAYFDRAIRKATDETPRVKALIARSPKRARADLAVTALELTQKLGGAMPKSSTLLAAHEKKIARQLRRYGIADAPGGGAGKPAVAAAKNPAVAGKPAAKAAAGAKPERASNGERHIPTREELLEGLDGGDLS